MAHAWSLLNDHFVAGIAAGALATCSLHPLDFIKIQRQVSEDNLATASRVMKRTLRDKGTLGLYRGLSSNLLASTISWGSYFFLYDGAKSLLLKRNQCDQPRLWHYFCAATLAGAATVFISNPFWLIRTKVISSLNASNGHATSIYSTFRHIIRKDGLGGLYRGLVPGLIGISHGGIQFMIYEELKNWKRPKGRDRTPQQTSTPNYDGFKVKDYLLMSSCSKLVASISTYPYQVVRSRLQKATMAAEAPYTGVIHTIVRIWRNEGCVGFYKGMVPNALRVLPGTCITFLTYEKLLYYLQKRKDNVQT